MVPVIELGTLAQPRCAAREGTLEPWALLCDSRRLRTRARDGAWRAALPGDASQEEGAWHFALPDGGIEPLLRALLDGDAGIESLSIERPGLHDAFVAIAGAAAAQQMRDDAEREAVA